MGLCISNVTGALSCLISLDGATTFSITTFSIMTLSIKGWYMTLSINDIQHNWHSAWKHSIFSESLCCVAIYLLLCWMPFCIFPERTLFVFFYVEKNTTNSTTTKARDREKITTYLESIYVHKVVGVCLTKF
jgi:hypothetical protein